MHVFLNDKPIEITANQTMASLLETNGMADKSGIAVALNNRVVPKGNWPTTQLNEQDKIMIITATAGG